MRCVLIKNKMAKKSHKKKLRIVFLASALILAIILGLNKLLFNTLEGTGEIIVIGIIFGLILSAGANEFL